MNETIERLAPSQRQEAVDVLCAAFRDYPVMRYILGNADNNYDERLAELIGFFCDKRFTRGWPVLAVREAGRCVAVASVNEPEEIAPPPALLAGQFRLRNRIGDEAMARLEAFESSSDGNEPDRPHHFIGMLGVLPDCQGRGHGGKLLDAVAELSRDHPLSEAVCLTTEDEANLPFYQSKAFRITAEADVGSLHSWSLMRETR